MSRGYAQRTVKFINKVGTFTTYLQSSQGDLWQSYSLNGGTFQNIVPNYATLQPVLYFICISSRTSGVSNVNGVPSWYFGSTLLNSGSSIDATISGHAASEYFELVSPSSRQPYYGLKIKKDIVELTGGSSITIKAVGELLISATGTTDTVQASTTVSIMPSTNNGVRINILDVTAVSSGVVGRNFTFTEDGQTIKMRCQTYEGSTQLDATSAQILANVISYQWQRILNGAWSNISGATSQEYTVSEDDVMTYQQYRCAVYRDGGLIGYGTANIMDATDPFVINPNPNPLDETIEDEGDTVVYTPQIVSRNTGAVQTDLTAQKFNFTITASDGNAIVSPITAAASCTVTYAMCQSYGDILVGIETVADLKDY